MDNMKNVLHMDNVTMQFGGVVAVNGLSLDVNEHEIVEMCIRDRFCEMIT